MTCLLTMQRRPAHVLGLVLLLAQGCGAFVGKPRADKEGVKWTCADLKDYLDGQGIKLFALDDLSQSNDAMLKSAFFVDDEAALTRMKTDAGSILTEKRAGTGAIAFIRHTSAEAAKGQPRPTEDSCLLWGRFIIVVVDSQPPGSKKESGNARSRELVQKIRDKLGS